MALKPVTETKQGGQPKRTRRLLAQKLKLLRFTRGWSQEVLAELCGLHRSYISEIERQQINVSLDNLEKLADAFEITASELLSGPRPEDFLDHPNNMRCEEPAAYYGAVVLETVH